MTTATATAIADSPPAAAGVPDGLIAALMWVGFPSIGAAAGSGVGFAIFGEMSWGFLIGGALLGLIIAAFFAPDRATRGGTDEPTTSGSSMGVGTRGVPAERAVESGVPAMAKPSKAEPDAGGDRALIGSPLLVPKALEKLGRMEVIARTVVEGYLTGRHRSRFRGAAIEFAQHREYVPGDDMRHLDWKVFARRDRYTIKQYEVETNLSTMMIVDGSQSMHAGSPTKYFTAAAGAASLGWLLLRQQDTVGAAMFDDDLRDFVPPRGAQSNFREVLRVLETREPQQKTGIDGVLRQIAERLPRRGLVALFSDCFVDPDELSRGLTRLRHRGHQVVVFHTLATEEIEFPYERMTRFVGLEETGELLADPRSLRRDYLDAMKTFCAATRRACARAGTDYVRLTTGDPLDSVLAAWQAAAASVRH